MSKNTTNQMFRNKFRTVNDNVSGIMGKRIYITDPTRKKSIEEGELRKEIQCIIKRLVEEQHSTEQIKKILDKEEYKNYEHYIDEWIGGWVIRFNPNIKSIIVKSFNRNKEQEDIEEKIRIENEKIYELYKTSIQKILKNEREVREKRKEKNQRNKEEER